jgi:hypothetical protein
MVILNKMVENIQFCTFIAQMSAVDLDKYMKDNNIVTIVYKPDLTGNYFIVPNGTP